MSKQLISLPSQRSAQPATYRSNQLPNSMNFFSAPDLAHRIFRFAIATYNRAHCRISGATRRRKATIAPNSRSPLRVACANARNVCPARQSLTKLWPTKPSGANLRPRNICRPPPSTQRCTFFRFCFIHVALVQYARTPSNCSCMQTCTRASARRMTKSVTALGNRGGRRKYLPRVQTDIRENQQLGWEKRTGLVKTVERG